MIRGPCGAGAASWTNTITRHDGSLGIPLGALHAGQHREALVRVRIVDPAAFEGRTRSLARERERPPPSPRRAGQRSRRGAGDGRAHAAHERRAAVTSSSASGPIETRLLVRHADGEWGGYIYKWTDDGHEAFLLENGKVKDVAGTPYTFPSRAQCLACHTPAAGFTLGLETAQLNYAIHFSSVGAGVFVERREPVEHRRAVPTRYVESPRYAILSV